MADEARHPPRLPGKRPARLPGPPKPGPAGKATPQKTGLETIKEESRGLRGTVAQALQSEADHFDEAEKQILKFHGLYQQDDRDRRKEGRRYAFMVRSKIPGGRLTAAQYLVHEALADGYGNGTLRITTRQDFQLHGVLKGDLRASLRAINQSLVTTLGACGDLVRNVMCCPVPVADDPVLAQIEALAQRLSDHFTPRTRAYHEIWLDGEKVYNGAGGEEPIYGEGYLPRKFKIAVARPGDNCVDVYTQDVGLVAVAEDGAVRGFNLLAGGGMGMTHKKPNTFPRLADALAFVTPAEAVPVVEQIVRIQREHGDRTDRRQARLKYLIHRWGVDRFRRELERRLGYALPPPAPTPPLDLDLHLGWHAQGDGRWFLGLSVENGRIQDTGARRLKTALHEIVDTFRPGVRLTANHDLLLTDLCERDRAGVEAVLRAHGIPREDELSNARKYAMACPALPTCGLALAESERVLPAVLDEIERDLAAFGLAGEKLSIRMTGCPNGCARPYVADLGFVGRSADRYAVFVGGRRDGTRLNQVFRDLVPLDELAAAVRPLFALFAQRRAPGEAFGDFCDRLGLDALQSLTATPASHEHAR